MKRRELITLLGGAVAASSLSWPVAARAQKADRIRRIGMLLGFAENDPESPLRIEAFRQTLDQLGRKEGLNLHIDYRWGAGDPNRMQVYAMELIRATADVVVAESTPATSALQRESRTTPIIFINVGNPVGSGLVASFAHPGGNITGFTNYIPSMGGKWLELLKEIVPQLTRA